MRFEDPLFLLLLLAAPLFVVASLRLRRDSRPGTFSSLRLLGDYRPTWRVRSAWAPTAVRALALALFVLALARPQSGQAESEIPSEGIDIVLTLDISGSMSSSLLGDDTRLDVAERAVSNFISGREDDRIGIVVFREESLILSPMTLDYDALQGLIPQMSNINLSDGTGIGLGLSDALNLLRDSKARSRVVVLLTDGENNVHTIEPLAAARIAEKLGVRVYTIGVIDPRLRQGRAALNVDEQALQEMANVTGGKYFSADSEEALHSIYDSIDDLEKSRVGRIQYAAYTELSLYFIAAGLALVLLESLLRSTVWRRAAG